MAQVLKEEVQKRIVEAALVVFAQKGYAAATIGEIAAGAGISTGNVYRYYENKEALFDDAVSERFVRRFSALLRQRVEALARAEDERRLGHPQDTLWIAASEELMRFTIENRLRLVILLDRARGTRWEGFADETAEELVRLAIAYVREARPSVKLSDPTRFALRRIYDGLIVTTARILAEYEDEARIREAVASYLRYHLAGLRELLAGE